MKAMAGLTGTAAVAWHARPVADAARELRVDPRAGLSSAEAARRRGRYGPNRLAETPREPRWRVFLRQFQNLLILILLAAAAVSLAVTREWETPVVIGLVVLLNATIGFVQESRAEASLEALKRMLVTTATVRRDGRTVQVDAAELVPGDVMVIEAGDRVPADGRLLSSASLEVQESSLTGEAQPVGKSAAAEVDERAPLGDQVTAVFMNTMVTRGRGEALVTATGMATETGRIAHMLHEAEPEPTPLQRQIDGLGRTLALVAGVVIVVVFVLGVARGLDLHEQFVSAVSLAVAAVPEGLPAVVAFTLAMGASRLARQGAIIKRLASVETLGSTSQICTDKTGTLTLNQMTGREMLLARRRFTVSGEGYSTNGRIRTTDGSPLPATLGEALTAMALCSDAVLRDGEVVGDPTEGALVVLAEKGGIDVRALREEHPRQMEIPFDSDYKFMATFHRWTDERGHDVVRCFLKGAPDVLARRADRYLGGEEVLPFDDTARQRYGQANTALAEQGMRVLAVGAQDFPADRFVPPGDPKDLLGHVLLIALVGIVDPPRPEARQAIRECRDAGIQVRMITGDHAVTAGAIAAELGIPGQAVSGADLDQIDDRDLPHRLDSIGVVARVSPAHKLRIVRALQARRRRCRDDRRRGQRCPRAAPGRHRYRHGPHRHGGDQGSGNDGPHRRQLRDHRARHPRGTRHLRQHRELHPLPGGDSLRFRAHLPGRIRDRRRGRSSLHRRADPVRQPGHGRPARVVPRRRPGQPRRDAPPAASPGEHILTRQRLLRIMLASAVMAGGTLAVLAWAPGPEARPGQATVASTMAFVTFVFYQAFALLIVRHPTRSVFTREALENSSAFIATGAVVVMLILVVQFNALHGFFTTTDLTPGQWLACAAVSSTILWIFELVKLILRTRSRRLSRPQR